MTPSPAHTLFRVAVTNETAHLAATRRFVADLILACFRDRPEAQAYAERLSTASGELLENAFVYSPAGTTLAIRLARDDRHLRLQVGNALRDEAHAVLDAVRRQIGEIWGETDAREAFRKKVLASLAEPGHKAALGYAKIRMETGGRLQARLGSGGRLDVILTFPLDPEATVR